MMKFVYVVKMIFQYYDEETTPENEIFAIYANVFEAISAAEAEMKNQVGENGTYISYDGDDDCEFGFESDLETGRLNIEVKAYPLRGERL